MTIITTVNALLKRPIAIQVTGLLVAAAGTFFRYVAGLDISWFPVGTIVLVVAALVVALVRYRWAPAAGLVAALYAAVRFVADGTAARLVAPAGPDDLAGVLAVALGLAVSLVAGVAATLRAYDRGAPPRNPRMRARFAVLLMAAGLVVLLVLTAAGYLYRNVNYASWDAARAGWAGFVERQVEVNGTTLNYAEGPDNGPPLLLVHGQSTDWQSWDRVLPELSRHFHVLAVDVHGHGRSDRAPEKYTANAIAADLEQLLRDVAGEPAIVAGHSSGGLVAAGMAADAPDLVRGVILEDPPFFSSVLPRAEKTFNHVGLATSAHNFLSSGETDFTSYDIRHGPIWDLFGPELGPQMREQALTYRAEHPNEPVLISYMPPELNEAFRAMDSYDPRFGEAFYTGSFHAGFDHAEVLSRIAVPAVLIHTNWQYDANGILQAAMDGADAERARSLIRDVEFHKVDTGHSFHFENPSSFIGIALAFAG